MKTNHLKLLETFGQSVWLDYLRRDLITRKELQKLIFNDGLKGITSNPTIFESALANSYEYDDDIKSLTLEGKDVNYIYESIIMTDIKSAADEFRQLYNISQGKEGFVSLEVNPHLAYDTSGTIEEARHLWNSVNRPNIFIKVPATDEGLPAIQQLTSEGINVNVTLLFGLPRYRQVAEAYIDGIKSRIENGNPVKNITSVASFFLSRIDSEIDPKEEDYVALGGEQVHFATNIKGQVAISSAKMASSIYKEIFESKEFNILESHGATPQKLLWASTGTKNPDYSDIKYIDSIIGKNTINTIPPDTLKAYRDHGNPSPRLETHLERACWVMSELPELGIDIDLVAKKLENDGVEKFIKSFDKLMETLTKKSQQILYNEHRRPNL